MALLYPHWLRIVQLREFLAVSAIGHLVYGAVLGIVVRQMLSARLPPAVTGRSGPPEAAR